MSGRPKKTKTDLRISKKIGDNIRACREKSGLTQTDVAKKLKISHQAVSQMETLGFCPTIPSLVALSRVYQTPLTELLAGVE